ncbi:hypothetical protein [Desulfovibrio gilichinskyi]|uniref:Uncharacterized protein n=1 Tax=Desulfovibrio gilichinskyi TaxID=1519643 RepID=A0A1X7CS69_9BACT|nr:hypothetical protein [Desulfovibrio gilichinskyi]SMF02080.1 hypothetical protein SAMN06295933_1178 [Desulfovibrio gilichinskyi]
MGRFKSIILISLCLLSCWTSKLSANADDILIADCSTKVLTNQKDNSQVAFKGSVDTDLVPVTTDGKELYGSLGDTTLEVLKFYYPRSSGPGGCVMNPTAGFGIDWALLAIIILMGFLRSRMR